MPTLVLAPHRAQRGVALPVVIVLVLLSALLVLWGFRAAIMNEAIVGNDADYQRAYEAAQALLQDAEQDISGQRSDGSPCAPNTANAKVCRTGNTTWFIDEEQHLTDLINALDGTAAKCADGICLKRTGNQDFWNEADTMRQMIATGTGARYGEYTGASHAAGSNPILANRAAGEGGWYWVEIMPYEKASPGGSVVADSGANKLTLRLHPSLAYRITAIARGLKPNTQVVLQSTYVQQRTAD